MWQRAVLKDRAKNSLRGTYWKAFLVCLVIFMLNAGGQGVANKRVSGVSYSGAGIGYVRPRDIVFAAGVTTLLLVVLILFIVKILIVYNLEVGGKRYFIQAAQGDVKVEYLAYGLQKGRYINIVKSMLWRSLFQVLWTFVFVIPGIIKSYSYSMVPYILADNPEIDYRRALKLSIQMTKGEKWNIFKLRVSFLGWYFLGLIACFVGVVFVQPYEEATFAELYLVLRKQVIDRGLCDYRELNLIREEKPVEEMWENY